VSPNLIKFVSKYAEETILDVGCATGAYCKKLEDKGFKCTGVDINQEYIKKAREDGINAYIMDIRNLKFKDDSFDTVILFEVLEHIDELDIALDEVKKVAAKNILITVPNCSDFYKLKFHGLTYEHMLEKDHINFFTKKKLENLLSQHFKKIKVIEAESLALEIVTLPKILRYPIQLLYNLNLIDTNIYNRLYAVIEVD
jgi:SAM-dependent methyltransferase